MAFRNFNGCLFQNFYEELNRHEMYLRYIWKLYTSHITQKNFVEAAYTLEMYASKLQVDKSKTSLMITLGGQNEILIN